MYFLFCRSETPAVWQSLLLNHSVGVEGQTKELPSWPPKTTVCVCVFLFVRPNSMSKPSASNHSMSPSPAHFCPTVVFSGRCGSVRHLLVVGAGARPAIHNVETEGKCIAYNVCSWDVQALKSLRQQGKKPFRGDLFSPTHQWKWSWLN